MYSAVLTSLEKASRTETGESNMVVSNVEIAVEGTLEGQGDPLMNLLLGSAAPELLTTRARIIGQCYPAKTCVDFDTLAPAQAARPTNHPQLGISFNVLTTPQPQHASAQTAELNTNSIAGRNESWKPEFAAAVPAVAYVAPVGPLVAAS